LKRRERAIILLKPQFLGDAVMACPLIDAAVAAYEHVTVSCGPIVRQVLDDRADRVHFLEGGKISGVAPVLRTARQLRNQDFHVAFIVNRSFRSALAVRLAGIPIRVGHSTEGRGFLLTHRVRYDALRPESECQLDLIANLGLPRVDPRPSLSVHPGEVEAIGALIKGIQIGVQPGARYPEKQIPLPVLAEIVNRLVASGHSVALFGGPDEEPYVDRFQSLLQSSLPSFVGKLAIRESMAAMARLNLMIGSDTGLMHLAAAVGCPTVTVFGPNPAQKWGHNHPPHQVLEAPRGSMVRLTADDLWPSIQASLGS